METGRVLFAVRAEFLYIAHVSCFSFGRAVVQAGSRRAVTVQARVRSQVTACGICGGQSGTEAGFSPSASGFPRQYQPMLHTHLHIGITPV
jgi:cytochrome c553